MKSLLGYYGVFHLFICVVVFIFKRRFNYNIEFFSFVYTMFRVTHV